MAVEDAAETEVAAQNGERKPEREAADDAVEDVDFTNRRARVVVGLILVTAVLAVGVWVTADLMSQARVQIEDIDEPPWSMEQATLGSIDLAELHSTTLPLWYMSLADAGAGSAEFEATHAELTAQLGGAPQLAEVLGELTKARSEAELAEALMREEQLVAQWNDRLRELDRPWAIKLPLSTRLRRGGLFTLSYFVPARVEVTFGERTVPVTFASRVDTLNVVEAYLGHATVTASDAFVSIDRIAETTANTIWPLLVEPKATTEQLADPEASYEIPHHALPFVEAARAVIEAAISADAWRVLTETTPARQEIVAVRARVNRRDDTCRTGFRIRTIPLRSLDPELLRAWREDARPLASNRCSAITPEEIDRLERAGQTLRRAPGLRPAIQELVAAVARTTAIHEARHIADFDGPLPCEGCPDWMRGTARNELSAYTAVTASGEMSATGLMNTCEIGLTGRGSRRRAVLYLASALMDEPCAGALPEDFVERARVFEQATFGREVGATFGDGYPAQLASRVY